LGPLSTAATNRPIVPAPGDYDDGQIGGMIGRGNWSTRRKPAPVPLSPLQTPHAARTRTRAAAVGSQRLTASVTARPSVDLEGTCKSLRSYIGDNKTVIFWDITPCSALKVNRRFRGTCHLHLQGRGMRQAETSMKQVGSSAWLILRPWRLRWHIPVKRWFTFSELHAVMSYKIIL
jgi:hypothetical protein